MVRELNEDSYIFEPPFLLAVADGMGGHVAGEVASNLAVKVVSDYMKEHSGEKSPELLLEEAIVQANDSIYRLAQSKTECSGMGTTLTAVYILDGQLYWGHVGDSRAYLFRNQELLQLTQDHSLVWELVQSGSITKDEAHNHPRRNLLTRAVGTNVPVRVDCGILKWQAGDMLLLCTDGLNALVEDESICRCLQQKEDGARLVEQLVDSAKAAGGYDNITVILLVNEGV
jgi:protein phosphatase